MNIKPTPEQVIAWAEQAYNAVTYADVEDKGTHRRVIENKIAELAAQWGYEQAQQTTVEEPELPDAVAWSTGISFEQAGTTRPRSENIFKLTSKRQPEHGFTLGLYTAAQMHDHYAAGVRAGMGQSQALQRGLGKVLADPEKHGLDLGEKHE
jgi:hypothetical protein